jgi:type I restriction enzyme S subunit
MRPRKEYDAKFLEYFYLNLDKDKRLRPLYRGLRNTIPKESFFAFKTILPPHTEQVAIASFLDDKVGKIDEAIAQKEQLIQLLGERKQIIIQNAVTKGLNPNAPMRDSGIEWLGEVPKHWKIVPLSSVSDVVDPNPSHRNPVYTNEGFPFISTIEFIGVDDLEMNTPRRVAEVTVQEQERRCNFQKGSIAFSRKGTIGAVRILPYDARFALLDSVCVINSGSQLEYKFLYQQVRSSVFYSQLGQETRGAALPQVSVGKVRSVKVFLPPLEEQQDIVNFLSEKLSKLGKSISLSEKQIILLRERRTALISATVTGKIDVRSWQAPKSATQEAINGG